MGSFFGSVIPALALSVASASAGPGSGERIAVLPLQWEGEPNPGARPQLQERLDGALTDDAQIEWVSSSAMSEAMAKAGEKCEDLSCQREAAESLGASYLVIPKVTLRDRVYRAELQAVAVDDGTVVAETSEFCEICGVGEVAELLSAQVMTLQPTLAALLRGQPVLEVVTAPPGAQVIVDGTPLGETPLTVELEAGRHLVRLEAPDRISQEREILSVEGAREMLNIEMPLRRGSRDGGPAGASDASGPSDRRTRAMTVWGGVSLGVGLGLLGAGIPLIAIHDRQNKFKCEGDNVDINGTCRYSYDTLGLGIGLAAGGAVLTTVGIALVAVGAKRKRKSSSLALRPTVGWRSIGVSGRF